MGLFSPFARIFASSETRVVLSALDDLGTGCPSGPWVIIRERVEKQAHAEAASLATLIREGGSIRRIVAITVANNAMYLLESGTYCLHRGVLTRDGQALLVYYEGLLDELKRLGAIDDAFASRQKATVRANISGVG